MKLIISIFVGFLILLNISFLAILSCKHTSEPDLASLSDSYYPLHVGNEWHYTQVESDSVMRSIESTKYVNGKNYYVISQSDSETSDQLFREENGIIYRIIEDKEYEYLCFNCEIGEKWQELPYERYARIVSRSDTVRTNVGILTDCIRIISESKRDEIESLYAPGIGLVSSKVKAKDSAVIGGGLSLDWAKINNIMIKHQTNN